MEDRVNGFVTIIIKHLKQRRMTMGGGGRGVKNLSDVNFVQQHSRKSRIKVEFKKTNLNKKNLFSNLSKKLKLKVEFFDSSKY